MSKIYVILFLSFICVNICGASTDSRKAFIKKYKSIAIEEMDRTGPRRHQAGTKECWNPERNIQTGGQCQQPFRYQMPQLERGQFHHGR